MSGLSGLAYCFVCREHVKREDTESIRIESFAGLACKTHELVSVVDGKPTETLRSQPHTHRCPKCDRQIECEAAKTGVCLFKPSSDITCNECAEKFTNDGLPRVMRFGDIEVEVSDLIEVK